MYITIPPGWCTILCGLQLILIMHIYPKRLPLFFNKITFLTLKWNIIFFLFLAHVNFDLEKTHLAAEFHVQFKIFWTHFTQSIGVMNFPFGTENKFVMAYDMKKTVQNIFLWKVTCPFCILQKCETGSLHLTDGARVVKLCSQVCLFKINYMC